MAKFINGTSLLSVISYCLIISTTPGCALVENPSIDELYGQDRVVTASAQAALAADVSIVPRQRGYETTVRNSADGLVTHGALYFQDGFEASSTNEERFSWSAEDQLALPMGVGRFLINMVAIPISAVLTPPCAAMESDGHTSIPTKSERT